MFWSVNAADGGFDGIYSTLDRAMLAAMDHHLVPVLLGDSDVYWHQPSSWEIHPIDGHTDVEMLEWRLIVQGVCVATVGTATVDDWLPCENYPDATP